MRHRNLPSPLRVLIVSLVLWVPVELGAQGGSTELCPERGRWNPLGGSLVRWSEATLDDVAECLAAGADPEEALDDAVRATRFPTAVQMLLEAGADPTNTVALRHATEREDNVSVVRDILAALLDANADVSERYYGGTYTPLHLLLQNQPNSVVLVELLLGAGADANATAVDGVTPLHTAAQHTTNPAVLEALLAVGAGPNDERRGDVWGGTPLWIVVRRCRQSLVRPLLEYGADPNYERRGGTTLEAAESCARDRETEAEGRAIVRLLRAAGAAG